VLRELSKEERLDLETLYIYLVLAMSNRDLAESTA
jgi:hypothetical protein